MLLINTIDGFCNNPGKNDPQWPGSGLLLAAEAAASTVIEGLKHFSGGVAGGCYYHRRMVL
ncbi:hypothetical protein EMIT0373P_30415 [Pseudomonas chlororaphis]